MLTAPVIRGEPDEAARVRRERRLLSALQLAHLGSWEWDVARNTVEWSDELYEIYGVEPGSFAPTFESYLERVHPDDRARVQQVIGETVRRGDRFDFEERIVRPSGEVRLLRSVGECTSDADGRVIALLGVCQDITATRALEEELRRSAEDMERRVEARTAELARSNEALRAEALERQRSQLALERSEEYFRALIENSSDLASILDATGTILYQSPPIQRLLGWAPGELTGRKSLELIHEDDVPAVAAEIRKLVADPATMRRVECRYRHKDGSYRMLESFGRGLKADDASAGIIVNSRDITERRRVEDELRLQTAVLQAQGEAAIDGILVVGPDGRIVSWNQRFVELWGIPAEIVESKSDADAIAWVLDHLADPAAFVARIEYLYAHPGDDSRDELVLRDGRVFDRYSGPVRGFDGVHYGRIWWFRDISDQKRSQTALEQARLEAEEARARAERADLAKSEFLSRMSHELRTPLNSIIGFGQLLQRKELRDDQVKAVEYILKGGRHLLNLINEVLEIARIESNTQRFSLEPVSVRTVIQESLTLIRPLATEQDIAVVEADIPHDLFVRADRQRLTQVLLNLLSNAVKYGGPDAVIRIRCTPAPGDAGRIRIAVADTGPGIPEEKHERLFTPFERLGAEQSGVEGTGLGLALSRKLVEGMGGTLDFETTIGAGSTFWAELAVAVSPADRVARERPTTAPAAAHDAVTAPAATVLYIEDNLANLSLIDSVMASRPRVELMSALQGSIGIELARRHAPDLILLDLHLPDLPGEAVMRRLKEDAATRHIPIVFITADAMPGTAEKLLAAGADACLTKPLDIDGFLATLDRILAGTKGGP